MGHLNNTDLFRLEKVRQTVYGVESEIDIFDYPHQQEKPQFLHFNSNDIKKFSGLPKQKKSYFFQCRLNKSCYSKEAEAPIPASVLASQSNFLDTSLFEIESRPQIFERKKVQSQLRHFKSKEKEEGNLRAPSELLIRRRNLQGQQTSMGFY